MLKSILFASLALAAAPALAQPAAPAQPPQQAAPAQAPQASQAPTPEIDRAGEAFGMCIGQAIQAAPATATPEAAASTALSGCGTQRNALVAAIESYINSQNVPAAQKEAALAQVRSQFAQAEGQIAAAIRQARAGTPATPPSR